MDRPALRATADPPRRRRPGRRPAPPPPMSDPARYDSWLTGLYGVTLAQIDAACAGLQRDEAFGLFRDLDTDLWAVLLSGQYDAYPSIRAVLPRTPDVSIQARWNGWTGLKLLNESKGFYRRVRELNSA